VTRRFFASRALRERERATGQQDIEGRLRESVAQVEPAIPPCVACGGKIDGDAQQMGFDTCTACLVTGRARAHQRREP
jgi:hypothetical protein